MDKIYKETLDSFKIEKFQNNSRLENIISPNDKLTKTIFNLPAHEYDDVLRNGRNISVTETTIRGKKVQTHFELRGGEKIVLARSLNEYDRAVFDVCNSVREAGFGGTTRDSLFRALTGSGHRSPMPKQAKALIESLKRLMTIIEIDFSNTRDKMPKYKSANAHLVSPILPCKILDNVLVNGQLTTLIKLTDESPLMTIARAKKQIITSPVALRNIPGQGNTPLSVLIKSYSIRRVHEIISHEMTPTITREDILTKCDLINAPRWKQQDVLKFLFTVIKNLEINGVIKGFETKGGNSIQAITLII